MTCPCCHSSEEEKKIDVAVTIRNPDNFYGANDNVIEVHKVLLKCIGCKRERFKDVNDYQREEREKIFAGHEKTMKELSK